MSKIGLIDVDGHNFPNLALMKLSSWHKREGDSVEWYSGIEHYDRVYMSKVFAFTPDDLRVIQADEVVKGGSGYKCMIRLCQMKLSTFARIIHFIQCIMMPTGS
mgnify:CR=1 FL=1